MQENNVYLALFGLFSLLLTQTNYKNMFAS